MKIAIIGGGISGLTCAFWLKEYGHHVKVFEKEPSVGGWVKSRQTANGSIMDLAANGWLDNEPAVHRLIDALDAHQEHISVSDPQSTRWIVFQDKLVPAPLSPPMLLRTPLLSFWSKLRLLFEPFVTSKSPPNESLAEFVERRLGSGVVKGLLTPMVAGIYAANPSELDVRACFSKLVDWEDQYTSLFAALRSPKRPKSKAPILHTFRGGAGAICEMLARRISDENIVFEKIEALERKERHWILQSEHQNHSQFDHVVLACPAYSQSQLLQNIDEETAHLLDKISYSDVAVAISEYTEDSFPHRNRGFGALCAQDQELYGVLGILFSSDIFPSRTSGQSQRLLTRTILGGTRYPDVLDWSEQDIKKRVSQAHQIIFGQAKHQSSEVYVFKHKRAIPLYARGHDELQQKIRSQIRTKNDSLSLLGNHLFGVGVKDCIRNGEECAKDIHSGQILSKPT